MRILLTILILFSLTASSQTYTIGNTVVPYSSTDFISHGRGANTFFNTKQENPLPDDANGWAQDNHIRFVWSQLQPTSAGVYNWTPFDNAVASCISKGHQTMSFGIITISKNPVDGAIITGGAGMGYPLYVHTAMQGEGNPDWIFDGYWVPNWNSNNYLTAFETFMAALAAHVNTATVSGFRINLVNDKLDLLAYGIYGEWHTSGIGRGQSGLGSCLYTNACGPTGTVATYASLKRIVDAHINNFPNIPIRAVTNAFITFELPAQICHYLLTSSNAWGRLGWGTYHLGSTAQYYKGYSEENSVVYAGDSLRPLIMNRWKEAPIFGEPLPNATSEVTKGGVIWGDLETQVRLYHVSQFNNNYNYGGSTYLTFRAASKASGYRWQYAAGGTMPDSLRPNTVFPIRMIWQNVGLAPMYKNYRVTYEFRQAGVTRFSYNSTWSPFLNTLVNVTVTDNVPGQTTLSGSYDLYVIWRDVNGYTLPISLANTGKQGDGSYLIRSGIRVGVNGSTPPPPPPPPVNIPPTAYAGSDISDTLPAATDTLHGIVSDANADAVTVLWSQLSGPNTATMATANAVDNILTGLIEGTYSFRLTANDGRGGLASDDVNLFMVNVTPPPPPPPPPPVYAPPEVIIRGDTTIQYTADSAYLVGLITDTSLTAEHDTTIASVKWTLYSYSGTTPGTIVSSTSNITKVTGLTPGVGYAGIYQYIFTVTDKAGNIVTSPSFRRVIVLPVVIPDPLPLPGPPLPTKVFGVKKQ